MYRSHKSHRSHSLFALDQVWATDLVFFWPFPASFFFFLLFLVFSIQLTVNKCSINFYRWLISNRGPLVSETTALPTEPQPLPHTCLIFLSFNLLLIYTSRSGFHNGRRLHSAVEKPKISVLYITVHCGIRRQLWLAWISLKNSVTRLGNLLDFGQLFKAFGNN